MWDVAGARVVTQVVGDIREAVETGLPLDLSVVTDRFVLDEHPSDSLGQMLGELMRLKVCPDRIGSTGHSPGHRFGDGAFQFTRRQGPGDYVHDWSRARKTGEMRDRQ